MKGWEKTFYASRNQKRAEVTILLADKVDFKPKMVVWKKEGHNVSYQEDIKIINIHSILEYLNMLSKYYQIWK